MPTEHSGLFATSFTVKCNLAFWLKLALLVHLVMERQPPWEAKEIENWGREAGGHASVCEDTRGCGSPSLGGWWCESGRGTEGFGVVLDVPLSQARWDCGACSMITLHAAVYGYVVNGLFM